MSARSFEPLCSAKACSTSLVWPRKRRKRTSTTTRATRSSADKPNAATIRSTLSLLPVKQDRLTLGPCDLVPSTGRLYSIELDLTSFDDLPLGGEWTTRRRTISDSEIALFSAVSGDFSPLSVDASTGSARHAPPALVVAVAAGLASMDMPIPHVAAWEWANWKFPKPVVAGDTIYARWTLTQKRAPVGGARTSIAVWRVDVHTTDGAVCAEGDVGASVFRAASPARQQTEAGAAAAAAPSRRRRRRARGGAAEQPPQAPAAAPQPAVQAERPAGTRRRRRRRSSSGSGNGNGLLAQAEPGAAPTQPALPEPEGRSEAMAASPANRGNANPLSRVMKRLRRTP
ncbi:MAG: hypothetical protein E6I39_06450 [Chloroflexi bacterium]|nr:MAG: hypothetical protein E6I98_09175 [Chloroflexota bacterium]TMF00131.1 MAG: hypothetical protein E6I39_06450 [Chloroflexota bacterium]